jgi:hypothetical protein
VIGLIRWFVRLEIGIWRSLFLWLIRRVPGKGPRTEDFSYAKEVTPIIVVFIFLSALETAVVHLLVPWEPARMALLIVGVWGLLWMLGYLASVRVFRHLLDDDGLRIRYGAHDDLRIPWYAMADVTAQRGHVDARGLRVQDGVAHVPVLKQTRVRVTLERPIDGFSEVRFYADDPRALVAAARERIEAARRDVRPA